MLYYKKCDICQVCTINSGSLNCLTKLHLCIHQFLNRLFRFLMFTKFCLGFIQNSFRYVNSMQVTLSNRFNFLFSFPKSFTMYTLKKAGLNSVPRFKSSDLLLISLACVVFIQILDNFYECFMKSFFFPFSILNF